jgi:hypothetical protein
MVHTLVVSFQNKCYLNNRHAILEADLDGSVGGGSKIPQNFGFYASSPVFECVKNEKGPPT